MKDSGFIAVREKRNLVDHCTWLARRLVLGHTFRQIAIDLPYALDREDPESTVKKAVASLKRQIGLAMPDRPPGRPRKPGK